MGQMEVTKTCVSFKDAACCLHVENGSSGFLAACLMKAGPQEQQRPLSPVAELRFAFFESEAPSSSDAAKVLNSDFRFLGRKRENHHFSVRACIYVELEP